MEGKFLNYGGDAEKVWQGRRLACGQESDGLGRFNSSYRRKSGRFGRDFEALRTELLN